MPISKGQPWGSPGALPENGVVVRSDAEARAVVERARKDRTPPPPLGLLGGDLCRTLGGGRRSEDWLRSPEAVRFQIDLGVALLDGRIHLFVAHLVARSALWRRAFVAMNAQWVGNWNLGPRAHPGDGLLDVYEATLPLNQVLAVRGRLHHGAHLPHPNIRERRMAAAQVAFEKPLFVRIDGVRVGPATNVAVRLEPDALTVVV